jgi:hypothetical protein
MRLSWRRIYVGLFALQIVLAGYLLFTYLGGRSRITIEKPKAAQSQILADSNEVGRLGPLGIGAVQKARFVNFNDDKQVSREFGFEELLHKTGDQWEISKPFLNLYLQDFDCRITAESGVVLAEDLAGTTDIKEATLRGNVVAHITPKSRTGLGQIDIYLDDIVFISNRSLFLTAGPVKVLAKDMQLLGRGLEVVYNYAEDRLELFRIIELESLCLNRIANKTGLYGNDLPAASDDKPQSIFAKAAPAAIHPVEDEAVDATDRYRAVLNTNVIVRSAGQLLTADDKLTIRNIIRRKDLAGQNPDAEPVEPNSPESSSADNLQDVVVTCRQGLVVCPMDIPVPQDGLLTVVAGAPAGPQANITEHSDVNSLRARAIDYDALTREAVAAGPVKLTYHAADYASQGGNATVTITAQDKLTYHPDSRRVIFEGNCLASFTGSDFENQRRYTIAAPKITAVLAAERHGAEPAYVQHIAAEGGATAVVHHIQADRDIARFIAPRIEYFTDGGNIVATGQSELTLWSRMEGASGKIQPVRITAKDNVRFTPALNTIVFEGDCFCETVRENALQATRYTLQAQNLSIELQQEQKGESAFAIAGVKKVIARDDAVITAISLPGQSKIAEFTANEIVYDSADENVSATGLSRLLYFAKGTEGQSGQPGSITDAPLTITAQDSTIFSLASNQAFFRGQCVCTMIRADTGTARKYRLTAPEVSVDIASSDGGLFGSAGIDYLTAGDNAVIVVTPINSVAELARFTASRIKYHAVADSIIADGPCDFTFYANDFMPTKTLGAAVPVQIYAERKTTFLPARNQLTFEGECICTMVRSRPDSQSKYTLSAPRITIDLSKREEQDLATSAIGIEKFTADGGMVQISSVKTASDRLVAFNKIKCRQFVYDTDKKLFTAAGPGIITVDNSNIDPSPSAEHLMAKQDGRLSITEKCYAFLRDFETLRFDLSTNRIFARNDESKMLADYFPIVNGQNSQQIKASAGVIEIELAQNTDGQDEISTLRASEGVTYEDADNQFSAGQMSYDAKTSLVKATGSDFHRCYLNGAIVDNVVYDLDRRAVVNIDLTDPGRVQVLK